MLLDRLLDTLVNSKNEAADGVLLEALRLGNEREQRGVLWALLRRRTVRGVGGVIALYDRLPEPLQLHVLRNMKLFHPALRECGRSDDRLVRLAALKLIALGRQGRLAYVLSENLHSADDAVSRAATEAMVALSRWVATETRKLQGGGGAGWRGGGVEHDDQLDAPPDSAAPAHHHAATPYADVLEQRPDIEAAVARAMDVHRGRHGQDLLRAALLLCDWPGSRTLAILKTTKHGGQSPMVRRLQQPPASEHVEAFLLGATHGQLRSHFGVAFSHIADAPVLDGLLRKTHWLKDHQLQLCLQQVTRGAWWDAAGLVRDAERRPPEEAAKIGEWVAASGADDVTQDERLEALRAYALHDERRGEGAGFEARLRLLRAAARRRRNGSVALLREFLADPDERLVRMAAREIVRRRPPHFESVLLQTMTKAPPSVRRVIGRAIGQAGFEHYWQRFDRLPGPVRRRAGRAMFKILPDALQRLERRLAEGPVEQRVKAMQMARELGVAEELRHALVRLCTDPNPRLRSKAVGAVGAVESVPAEVLVERLVNDADARVRANTIEALEARGDRQFVPVLARRALDAATPRERANAVKALHAMKVSTAGGQLLVMLRDERPDHRISALWALRQTGWWQLLAEVGRLAKSDSNLKVRRYALTVLRGAAELAKAQQERSSAEVPGKKAG